MKLHDIVCLQKTLTNGLPKNDQALFKIQHYPLFDKELALDVLGANQLVIKVFASFENTMAPTWQCIKTSYQKKNWQEIECLTHQARSGAGLGTAQLYFALLFTECYLKNGYTYYREKLYAQMMTTVDKTNDELRNYFNN